ncbi:MAG: coenzyme F420-0:L-glutamate ligase [Candidatus Bathyarchaeia archaeon]
MIQILGLRGIPLVKQGVDLAELIVRAVESQGLKLRQGDILVVAQKVVSKAEGRIVKLDQVQPSPLAVNLSRRCGKDPRLVEVILGECQEIVKMRGPHIIARVKTGHVCANAGVDASNVEEGYVTLLPKNPDVSAEKLRLRLRELTGLNLPVIISDTCGRPFRKGQVNLALGASGLRALRDHRGGKDMLGRQLSVTVIAVADELAAAAELVMKKADGIPVAVIRGFDYEHGGRGASELIRHPSRDLFA